MIFSTSSFLNINFKKNLIYQRSEKENFESENEFVII
jgi:hypothetical protein